MSVFVWVLGIFLFLGAEEARGLERLGMPARLEGNPGLIADFNLNPALAKGGVIDLQEVLDSQHRAFSRRLFGEKSGLRFHGLMEVLLNPGEYVVTLQASDEALGLHMEQNLHVTVPKIVSDTWSM